MAKGVINLQKESGGIVKISPVDGVGVTEVTVPESGELVTKEYVDSLKTIATGTATFNSTTNNINLTGIGIGVEVGDVIQISGAEDSKNNSEFTVEVITDNDNIIVNQAHANKGTTKNVANRSGDTGVTVKLLAKYYNASIELGRDWVNVTSSRALSTTYQNNTNRAFDINVVVTTSAGTSSGTIITIGTIATTEDSARNESYFHVFNSKTVVTRNSSYKVYNPGGTLNKFMELR